MNDPIAPFETDDVLSSVRRLVSQNAHGPVQDGQHSGKFLLTDALRVDDGAAEALNLAPYDLAVSENRSSLRSTGQNADKPAVRAETAETVTDRMADLMEGMFGAKNTDASAGDMTDPARSDIGPDPVVNAGSRRVDLEWAKQVVRLLGDRRISPDKAIAMMEQRQDTSDTSEQSLMATDANLRALVREELQSALTDEPDSPLRAMVQREVTRILADMQAT